MKVFKRVPKSELRLRKPSNNTNGIWWNSHLLLEGGYEEIEEKWYELTRDNPELTVAIGYDEPTEASPN